MLDAYDFVLEDESVIEVGRLRLHTILTPGHTPGSMCFRLEGSPVAVQRRHPVPRRPGQHQLPGRRLPDRSSASIDGPPVRHRSPPTRIVLPGHGDETTIGAERPHLQEWVDRGW